MTNTGNPWTNQQQDASYKYIWCQSKVSDLANQILPLMIKKIKDWNIIGEVLYLAHNVLSEIEQQ